MLIAFNLIYILKAIFDARLSTEWFSSDINCLSIAVFNNQGLPADHWQAVQIKNLMDQKPASFAMPIAKGGGDLAIIRKEGSKTLVCDRLICSCVKV